MTAAGLTGIRTPARILLIAAGLASIGIAASPEPVKGSTPQHLAWTSFGAAVITVWPAFAAWRTERRTLILSIRGAATVTAVFVALLSWVVVETQDGSVLGLAERVTSSAETTWPFIVALALRAHRPHPAQLPTDASDRFRRHPPSVRTPSSAPRTSAWSNRQDSLGGMATRSITQLLTTISVGCSFGRARGALWNVARLSRVPPIRRL